MSYTDRDLIELACRAPACPDWFEPDMSAFEPPSPEQEIMAGPIEALAEFHKPLNADTIKEWKEAKRAVKAFNDECARQKLIQWPKAYARMVLESK